MKMIDFYDHLYLNMKPTKNSVAVRANTQAALNIGIIDKVAQHLADELDIAVHRDILRYPDLTVVKEVFR